ncbi:MAG: GNAT family N-acetyltransferase [Candidatus Riflebacteria bacterium]|nr:GNAT family N-acetyltransferase [Candidatus Riflebacteria bacterium]
MNEPRYRIEWNDGRALLVASEADPEEVERQARTLSGWYNDDYNRGMMDHTCLMTPQDVVDHFHASQAQGGRVFLLYHDGELMGDGDFRGITCRAAEFAIMIGARTAQGKGLGTRFTTLLHAFAFRELKVLTASLTIVPKNVPGRRCYEKVGYAVDGSAEARAYADHDDDIAMSLPRDEFERRHGEILDQIRISKV